MGMVLQDVVVHTSARAPSARCLHIICTFYLTFSQKSCFLSLEALACGRCAFYLFGSHANIHNWVHVRTLITKWLLRCSGGHWLGTFISFSAWRSSTVYQLFWNLYRLAWKTTSTFSIYQRSYNSPFSMATFSSQSLMWTSLSWLCSVNSELSYAAARLPHIYPLH